MNVEDLKQIVAALEPVIRRVVAEELAKKTPLRAALTKTEAAKYLGVSTQTIWRLQSAGKIKKTSYGTYPIQSLDEHLRWEMRQRQ